MNLLKDVFSSPPLLVLFGIVGRSIIIYAAVFVGMRLVGTRALGKMSAYDFVLIVVVANAVQNSLWEAIIR